MTKVKAVANKKVAKKEKEFLTEATIKPSEKITCKFQLRQIAWKQNELGWSLSLSVVAKLDKAFLNYQGRFEFDDEPYLERIEKAETNKLRVSRDNKLFKEEKDADIQNCIDTINNIKEEMEKMSGKCPEIEFGGTITKVDWAGSNPSITIIVNDDVVELLNKVKTFMGNYRLILVPVIK